MVGEITHYCWYEVPSYLGAPLGHDPWELITNYKSNQIRIRADRERHHSPAGNILRLSLMTAWRYGKFWLSLYWGIFERMPDAYASSTSF